ncbi:MAG TPA: response regulator transcription factor [Gammaproteobacteria bacterium]|nr:response regulator transcription factor [Gammaproteobacteria bacterium]
MTIGLPMRAHKRFLIIDDDETFGAVLAASIEKRGHEVDVALDGERALTVLRAKGARFIVLDLRIGEVSGLELIPSLLAISPDAQIVVLTGFASIATAVEAIKLGAVHYLTKPADADEILAGFARTAGDENIEVECAPVSLDRLEWEYIQKTLNECGGNISTAAKRLGLHRRTLQRKLQKRPSGIK